MDELTALHERVVEQDQHIESILRISLAEDVGYLQKLITRAETEAEKNQAQTAALAQALARTAGLSESRYRVAGGICSGMLRYDHEATESLIALLYAARERGPVTQNMAWDFGLLTPRSTATRRMAGSTTSATSTRTSSSGGRRPLPDHTLLRRKVVQVKPP